MYSNVRHSSVEYSNLNEKAFGIRNEKNCKKSYIQYGRNPAHDKEVSLLCNIRRTCIRYHILTLVLSLAIELCLLVYVKTK